MRQKRRREASWTIWGNGEGVGVGDAPHKILDCIKKRRKT